MKHLNRAGVFPSGNPRFYFRPKGRKGQPLPDLPREHPDFLAAYTALLAAHEGGTPSPEARPATGTIAAAVRAYLASDSYLALAASTRGVWRRQLEDIEARYGAGALADLMPRHVRQDIARLDPHPANNRLKTWRSLGRFIVDAGLVDDDPTDGVRRRKAPESEGRTPWTRADVAAFRARWPHESAQRLAFEIMHRSCAAIGDACRLGPGMLKDGWLTYTRAKSKSEAVIPFTVPGPDWFEADDHLARCLALHPRSMVYLVTARGQGRSPKAAAQWFSRACGEAGLAPGKTAHGIRKHRAAVFKENGAAREQRMAILGHETETEAKRYSRSADLQKTIMGTESSNSSKPGSNFRRKSQ